MNEETGFSRSAISGADGQYLVPLLPIGDKYKLTVESAGFKTFIRSGIAVRLNQNVRIDVPLEIGAVAERVEVTGRAPLVDTHSATGGEIVESDRLNQLPLNGRNP